MIKAQDLRIGNIVKMPSSGELTKITSMDISDIQSNLKNRLSVDLSEEILLKVGFIKYPWFEGAYIKYNDSHLMIRWYKDNIIAFTCYVMDGKEEMLHKNVKHIKKGLIVNLHQLQNFYYFNTGQELNTSEL